MRSTFFQAAVIDLYEAEILVRGGERFIDGNGLTVTQQCGVLVASIL